MTVMMTRLGASLQGLGPGITPVGAIGAVQTSVDASLLPWNDNTSSSESRRQNRACDSGVRPPVDSQTGFSSGASARNRVPNDCDLVEFLPEITLRHKFGLDSLPESPTMQPKARNQSAVVSSLQSVTSSVNGPEIVPLVDVAENQPAFPSLAKSALISSYTGSRARTSELPYSGNPKVTRTGSVAQLRSLRSDTTELTEEVDSQTFGMIEAISPTATAPLHEDTICYESAAQIATMRKLHGPMPDRSNCDTRHTPEVSSEPKAGIVVVDGGYLGRWIFDRLSRQASRPSGGTTGVDPRVSATHPGAAVGI